MFPLGIAGRGMAAARSHWALLGAAARLHQVADCHAQTTLAGIAEKLAAEPDSSTGRGPRWRVDN